MEDHTYLLGGSLHAHKSAINPTTAAWLVLGYSLAGVLIFIWAFWTQHHRLSTFKHSMILSFTGQTDKLRGVQNIHYTLIPLLFIDALCAINEFGSAVAALSNAFCPNCGIMVYCWLILRSLGQIFHFLNVLVCSLYLYNPLWGVKAQPLCQFVTFLAVILFVFFIEIGLLGLEFFTLILGLCCIIAQFKVTPPSPTAAVQRRKIALVALLNFLVVFAPHFILYCFMTFPHTSVGPDFATIYAEVLFWTNFHIYMDGLLCYLILKLPFEDEQQQHQQDMSYNPNYAPHVTPS